MSLWSMLDEYEPINPYELDGMLAELQFDLIRESIIEQIDNPVSTKVNYISNVIDKCNIYKDLNENNTELITEIDSCLKDFFIFIIERIDKKYDLGIDLDDIVINYDPIDVGTAFYNYFILRYTKNIVKFVTNYITHNKSDIIKSLGDTTSKKDVSTLVYKKSIKNKDNLILITNLPSIIKFILSSDIDPREFINLSAGGDNYDASVILDLIDNCKMIGNFTTNYLDTVLDEHDYIIDEIQTDIKSKLIKKLLKD